MANTGQFRSESEFYDLDVSGDEGSEALVRIGRGRLIRIELIGGGGGPATFADFTVDQLRALGEGLISLAEEATDRWENG